jgi:VWFA-related protein
LTIPHAMRLRFRTFALFLSPLFAQAPATTPVQSSPVTTFHAQTELVTVPVIVTDKSGKHLTGLKQADFILEENGHPRPINSFEEVSPSSASFHLPKQPASQYANFVPSDAGVRRVTIIVLDLLNTPFIHQADARKQLIHYLAEHVEDSGPTSLSFLTSHGLRLVHSFTSDTSVLIAALQKVQSAMSVQDTPTVSTTTNGDSSNPMEDPSFSGDSASMATQLQQLFAEHDDAVYTAHTQKVQTLSTLAALEQIAQAYSGIPGRKALIWTTGGLPFLIDDPQSLIGLDTSLMENYQRTWDALNSASISVYPIDAHGLIGADLSRAGLGRTPRFPSRTIGLAPASAMETRQNAQDSMRAFAHATGGRPCFNTNDLAECFARAADDSSQYYLLSYYLPSDDRKPGWRKLKVQVNLPHVEVRARDGFFLGSTKQPEEHSLMQQFDIAAASPLDYTSIPLGVRIKSITATPSGEHKVTFILQVQPNGATIDVTANNHVFVDVNAVAEDDKGRLARVFGKTINVNIKPESMPVVLKTGFTFSNEITLPPGAFRLVRFVVRDELNGKMGTLTAPVETK